jgi:hypothetical protein
MWWGGTLANSKTTGSVIYSVSNLFSGAGLSRRTAIAIYRQRRPGVGI